MFICKCAQHIFIIASRFSVCWEKRELFSLNLKTDLLLENIEWKSSWGPNAVFFNILIVDVDYYHIGPYCTFDDKKKENDFIYHYHNIYECMCVRHTNCDITNIFGFHYYSYGSIRCTYYIQFQFHLSKYLTRTNISHFGTIYKLFCR